MTESTKDLISRLRELEAKETPGDFTYYAALRNAAPQLLAMAEAGEKMAAAVDYAGKFLATAGDPSIAHMYIREALAEYQKAVKE